MGYIRNKNKLALISTLLRVTKHTIGMSVCVLTPVWAGGEAQWLAQAPQLAAGVGSESRAV